MRVKHRVGRACPGPKSIPMVQCLDPSYLVGEEVDSRIFLWSLRAILGSGVQEFGSLMMAAGVWDNTPLVQER